MNKQEIFDTVAKHLLAQNQRSENDDTCVYRNPDGLKCAAGCLIPDERYDAKYEGMTVKTIYFTQGSKGQHLANLLGWLPSEEQLGLIFELQQIHDGFVPDCWARQLRLVAKSHKLDAQVLPPPGTW